MFLRDARCWRTTVIWFWRFSAYWRRPGWLPALTRCSCVVLLCRTGPAWPGDWMALSAGVWMWCSLPSAYRSPACFDHARASGVSWCSLDLVVIELRTEETACCWTCFVFLLASRRHLSLSWERELITSTVSCKNRSKKSALSPQWQGCITSLEGHRHNACTQHCAVAVAFALESLQCRGLAAVCSGFVFLSVCLLTLVQIPQPIWSSSAAAAVLPLKSLGLKFILGGDFFNSTLKEVTWHPADLAWSKTLSTGKTWDKQCKIKAIVGNELFSPLWAKRQAYFWFYTDSMCQW